MYLLEDRCDQGGSAQKDRIGSRLVLFNNVLKPSKGGLFRVAIQREAVAHLLAAHVSGLCSEPIDFDLLVKRFQDRDQLAQSLQVLIVRPERMQRRLAGRRAVGCGEVNAANCLEGPSVLHVV